MTDDPIRVLHVLTAMNMGGTETLLMNIYRNIDRTKIQFDFAVTTKKEGDYDNEILSLGGRVIHYPQYRVTNHASFVRWWKDFFSIHPEYRIIHGHIGSTAAIYLSIAKKYGRFTIAHSHSTTPQLSLHSVVYMLYSFPTRFIADYFFGCSKQAIIDRYGIRIANDLKKSEVLNNGIDSKQFAFSVETRERIRREFNIEKGTIVIGTVGRLTHPKNPYEIIRICKELKERGVEFSFWWFGKGELEDEIRKMIEINSLDNVHLMGTRRDINNVLQGMDIFIFPSIWEGLGIACVESQAAGLPTLCSDSIPVEACVSNLFEYLPRNQTRIWCDKIEKVIKKISENDYNRPDMRREIINNGYDIFNTAQKLELFYKDKVC